MTTTAVDMGQEVVGKHCQIILFTCLCDLEDFSLDKFNAVLGFLM